MPMTSRASLRNSVRKHDDKKLDQCRGWHGKNLTLPQALDTVLYICDSSEEYI
jgi:hypothetical protein